MEVSQTFNNIMKSSAPPIPPSPYLSQQYVPPSPYLSQQCVPFHRQQRCVHLHLNGYTRYRFRSPRIRKNVHKKRTYSYGKVRYHKHYTAGCMRLFIQGRCFYKKCEWSHKTIRGPNKWLKTSYKGKTHYRSPDGRVWCTWSKRYGRYIKSDPY